MPVYCYYYYYYYFFFVVLSQGESVTFGMSRMVGWLLYLPLCKIGRDQYEVILRDAT